MTVLGLLPQAIIGIHLNIYNYLELLVAVCVFDDVGSLQTRDVISDNGSSSFGFINSNSVTK